MAQEIHAGRPGPDDWISQLCEPDVRSMPTTKILRLSEYLPLVIEIVDSEDKINGFLPTLDGMMSSGLITLEKVQVLQYGTKGTGR